MTDVTEELLEVRIAVASAQEADSIAQVLVHERLAACVQQLPGMRSTYRWQGRVETATEILLTAKTTSAHFAGLAQRVRELHSYDVPEITAIQLGPVDETYAAWWRAALRPDDGMPTSHIETERKFTLPEGRPAPDAMEWPGVDAVGEAQHHHLQATYFDTTDVRLGRRGITLRRRTGGTDEGWHLKLPRDEDSRVEQWLPLGAVAEGEVVPRGFAGQLADVLAGEQLQPVCEVETRRVERDVSGRGVVLASVCEDYVWTRNLIDSSLDQAWREMEVELSHGGMDFLERVTAHLRECGVTQASISSKLRAAMGSLLRTDSVEQGAS